MIRFILLQCLMRNNQRNQFLLTIGTTQFFILELKNNTLSNVSSPASLTTINAIRQNRILKGAFTVFNLLTSMSKKVGLPWPRPFVRYIFPAPVPIRQRPELISNICVQSVRMLHQMRDSYLEHVKSLPDSCHLRKVHFYIYLLRKCINLMQLLVSEQ